MFAFLIFLGQALLTVVVLCTWSRQLMLLRRCVAFREERSRLHGTLDTGDPARALEAGPAQRDAFRQGFASPSDRETEAQTGQHLGCIGSEGFEALVTLAECCLLKVPFLASLGNNDLRLFQHALGAIGRISVMCRPSCWSARLRRAWPLP